MSDERRREEGSDSKSEYQRRAKEHTIAGGAVGAAGVGSLAVLGVTCPLCVVAAPALICSGAWNAYKSRKEKGGAQGEMDVDPRDGCL